MNFPHELQAVRAMQLTIPFYAKEGSYTLISPSKQDGKSGGGGAGGNKLVAINSGGNAVVAVTGGFHANHFTVTTNVHIPRGNHLLREREDEVDLAAIFEARFAEEIEPPVADIARIGFQFGAVGVVS